MYYSNLGYQWAVPWPVGDGVCIAACGVNSIQALERNSLDQLASQDSRIFDPQLYLHTLDLPACDTSARRLSTYSWINSSIPIREDGESLADWENRVFSEIQDEWPLEIPDNFEEITERVRNCIEFQIEFGVNSIILPAPLVSDPESDYSLELQWLDAGLQAVPEDCDLPIYATLAISDNCLVHRDPTDNELLISIVDQLTAREFDGVYLVVEQTVGSDGTFIRDRNVAWSILSTCRDINVRGQKFVIVNYLDIFGLVCLSAGASIFISGPTNRCRRLCFSDFESRGGGGSYPRFHSLSLLVDLLPKRDIENKILSARLLRLLTPDETPASKDFLNALGRGDGLEAVPEWHERLNNRRASDLQYQEITTHRAQEISRSADPINDVLAWLQNAERDSSYLAARFEGDPLSSDHRHISSWRSAFENFISQYDLQ